MCVVSYLRDFRSSGICFASESVVGQHLHREMILSDENAFCTKHEISKVGCNVIK